jgi:protoporphyrin/coproporphyrin ferrochelatase
MGNVPRVQGSSTIGRLHCLPATIRRAALNATGQPPAASGFAYLTLLPSRSAIRRRGAGRRAQPDWRQTPGPAPRATSAGPTSEDQALARVPNVEGFQALLLVSFGAPERREDVVPFLRRVTAGRGIPEHRIAEVAEHYYAAGGASPLNAQCRALMEALRGGLAHVGLGAYWGNRNWHPLLDETLAQMRDDGIERALAFVTSAYGGYSSCRQYLDDIEAARRRVGDGAPAVEKLRLFYNHPGWVGPWAANLAQALDAVDAGHSPDQGDRPEVVFTAHSIPASWAATSPYVEHLTESSRLVAEMAGVAPWQLAWQSRSGPPGSPWLEPDVRQVITASNSATVVLVPIGFVCDNMEITHDLDVEAAEAAKEMGANLVRVPTVSASPAFVEMVHELVQERLDPSMARRSLGGHGPWPDTCPQGHCPGGR